MNNPAKHVGDKIVEKFKQEVAEMSAEEALKQYQTLKIQLGKARIPIPRELRQFVFDKFNNKS